MSRVRCIGVGLALTLVSSSALAFQEQGGAPPVAPAAPEAKAAPQPAPASPDADMSFSAPDLDSGAGTEVRIPGLGKLGVLPKMDFGLELLYGANESKQQEQPQQQQSDEDLTIRGTVKHNF